MPKLRVYLQAICTYSLVLTTGTLFCHENLLAGISNADSIKSSDTIVVARNRKGSSRSSKPSSTLQTEPGNNLVTNQDSDATKYKETRTLGIVGVVNYIGPGVEGEYITSYNNFTDWGIRAGFTKANLSRNVAENINEKLASNNLHLQAFARFFKERTLYGAASLNLSSLQGNYSWENAAGASGSFQSTILSMSIFLGSEWNLGKNFYIGADWLGIGLPIIGQLAINSSDALEQTTSAFTRESAKGRVTSEISQQVKFYYLMLRTGYAF